MPLAGFDIDPCTAIALPGAGTIEYVPLDEVDVAAWNDAILTSTYNQQASAGVSTWYAMPYVVGSGSWTEEQQDTEQGTFFRTNVSATLAADSNVVRGELNAMKRRPYLLRITRNGVILLIGTPENPLRFESRFESGADGGDTRAHRIAWNGATLRKSPGYVPVF